MSLDIRTRAKELRFVRAGDLKGDPRNWRRHPQEQADTLTEMMGRIISPYAQKAVDVLALTRALQAQKGSVAISGYGQEWDHLGWKRHEYRTRVTSGTATNREERVEVLWCNYDPATGERL